MRRSKEELGKLHKEQCRELKTIRAQMAADLGIDLKQRECTYEGYCSGTCPKCKSEEMQLNAAILKLQMQELDMKKRVATAGLTMVAAMTLSGCVRTVDGNIEYEGGMTYQGAEYMELEGETTLEPEVETSAILELEGDVEYIE